MHYKWCWYSQRTSEHEQILCLCNNKKMWRKMTLNLHESDLKLFETPFIFSNENIEKPFYIAFKCFDAICTWCLCMFKSIYTSNIFIERKITPSLFAGWNKSFTLLSKSYKSFTHHYLYKVVNAKMHFGSDNRWYDDASSFALKLDNHFKVQHLLSSIFDLTFERCFFR